MIRWMLRLRNPWLALVWEQASRFGIPALCAPLGCLLVWAALWFHFLSGRLRLSEVQDFASATSRIAVVLLALSLTLGGSRSLPLLKRHQVRLPLPLDGVMGVVMGMRLVFAVLSAAIIFGLQWSMIGSPGVTADLLAAVATLGGGCWVAAGLLMAGRSRHPWLMTGILVVLALLGAMVFSAVLDALGGSNGQFWIITAALAVLGAEAALAAGRGARAGAAIPAWRRSTGAEGSRWRFLQRTPRFATPLSAQQWFERHNRPWAVFPLAAVLSTVLFLYTNLYYGHNSNTAQHMTTRTLLLSFTVAAVLGVARLLQVLLRPRNRAWRYVATLPVSTATLSRAAVLDGADDTLRCAALALFWWVLPWCWTIGSPETGLQGWQLALFGLHENLSFSLLAGVALWGFFLWLLCMVGMMPRWLLGTTFVVLLLGAFVISLADGAGPVETALRQMDTDLKEAVVCSSMGALMLLVTGLTFRRAVLRGEMPRIVAEVVFLSWLAVLGLLLPTMTLLLAELVKGGPPVMTWDNMLLTAGFLAFVLLPVPFSLEMNRWRHGRPGARPAENAVTTEAPGDRRIRLEFAGRAFARLLLPGAALLLLWLAGSRIKMSWEDLAVPVQGRAPDFTRPETPPPPEQNAHWLLGDLISANDDHFLGELLADVNRRNDWENPAVVANLADLNTWLADHKAARERLWKALKQSRIAPETTRKHYDESDYSVSNRAFLPFRQALILLEAEGLCAAHQNDARRLQAAIHGQLDLMQQMIENTRDLLLLSRLSYQIGTAIHDLVNLTDRAALLPDFPAEDFLAIETRLHAILDRFKLKGEFSVTANSVLWEQWRRLAGMNMRVAQRDALYPLDRTLDLWANANGLQALGAYLTRHTAVRATADTPATLYEISENFRQPPDYPGFWEQFIAAQTLSQDAYAFEWDNYLSGFLRTQLFTLHLQLRLYAFARKTGSLPDGLRDWKQKDPGVAVYLAPYRVEYQVAPDGGRFRLGALYGSWRSYRGGIHDWQPIWLPGTGQPADGLTLTVSPK